MMRILTGWRYSESGRRDLRLDFLRGYAVFAMIADHVAGISWISPFTGGNRFITSAAEGFVLLAGLVLGMVYGPRIARDGWLAAADPILRRAAVLYGVTVGLTLVFVALFQFTELRLWLDRAYGLGLADPVELVVGTLTLHFVYHGTDILFLYCVLIAVAPLLLLFLSRGHWRLVLAGSWLVWLAHQFYPSQVAIPWTVTNVYYFPVAGWQVIFVSALILGFYQRQAARFFGRVPPLAWLGVFTIGLVFLIVAHRAHDTGRIASWPILGALAGDLYDQLFDKPSAAIGRLVASVVVAGFAYSLVTVCWVPLRRALGWLLLPLGMSSLRAYGTHLLIIVVVYNIDVLMDLYDRSRTGNTVLQVVTVGLTYAVIVAWKRLEQGFGVDIGAGLLPSLLAYPRQRPLIASALALTVVATAATVLIAGPVRASRSVDPTEMTDDAGLLRYVPPGAVPEQPVPVLLVLHGEDTTGPEAARPLLATAERNGWAVIAPTLAYGDWSNPEQVVGDMLVHLPLLRDLVQPGEDWGEQAIGEHVLVIGEGRGAHAAIAFSLYYPETTAAVATIGPAPCTVPVTEQLATPDATALPFPFGIEDLEQYVGEEVDGDDLSEATRWLGLLPEHDVPVNTCPWGALTERPPEERASVFVSLLRQAGARAEVAVFRGADARETARASAIQFLTREPAAASTP